MKNAIRIIRQKGDVIEKLNKLGFNDVYTSDTASNVIIVTHEKDVLENCLSPIHDLTIIPASIPSRPELYSGIFSLGKRNLKIFNIKI